MARTMRNPRLLRHIQLRTRYLAHRSVAGTILAATLLVSVPATFAADTAYGYPTVDWVEATLSRGFLRSGESDPTLKAARSIQYLQQFPARRAEHYVLSRKELGYQVYRQNRPAPLVFVLGGLGANAFSGTSGSLADSLDRAGHHVLVLPSPFNWNFAFAASEHAAPGASEDDATDLLRGMKLAYDASVQHLDIKVTSVGAVGISLGALQLAWVLEENRRVDSARVED